MAQPDPATWWSGLSDEDKAAFIAAIDQSHLPDELAVKLEEAGIVFTRVGWVGPPAGETMNVLPPAYRDYIRSQIS